MSQQSELQTQRLQKFQEALQKQYIGCLFDIDGTLTVRGDEFIPKIVLDTLANLCERGVPMGVCTARKFEHAYEKIAPLFNHASNPLYCQKNFTIICENGCLGYKFNPEKKIYNEFYRIEYPYPKTHFDSLFTTVKNLLKDKLGSAFTCEVTMIFRPIRVDDPDREALAKRSAKLAEIVAKELPNHDPKGALKIGNSGIGITIFPAIGNKEKGIQEFAKYLKQTHGLGTSPNAKEIIVVGDQPLPTGNDESFLNGQYGTPFTVGETHPANLLPLPVYDSENHVMMGPEGTITLLQQLHFSTNL